MSSMLNISVKNDKLKVNPSIVNNVSINNSKLNRIPKKVVKPTTTREIANDESIKIIDNVGNATTYSEPTPYEAIITNSIDEQPNEQLDVIYEEPTIKDNEEVKQDIDKSLLNSVLLQYIQLLKEHNIIKANKLIISTDELANIILLITQADEVNISLNQDIGCSIGKIRLVDNIYVNKNNERKDFKIFYPNEYTYIRDLKINLKKVIIN